MPLGTSRSTVFTPPTTSVCPAFAPPWKRTTTSAQEVKRSTTFPFPSSPHCAPTITTFDMDVSLSRRRAAAVRDRHRCLLAQLRSIRRRLQLALDRGAAWLVEDERDESAVGDELAATRDRDRLAREHHHVLGRVEEEPVLRSRLPFPGADQPGEVVVLRCGGRRGGGWRGGRFGSGGGRRG